jgi:hypothetical protein
MKIEDLPLLERTRVVETVASLLWATPRFRATLTKTCTNYDACVARLCASSPISERANRMVMTAINSLAHEEGAVTITYRQSLTDARMILRETHVGFAQAPLPQASKEPSITETTVKEQVHEALVTPFIADAVRHHGGLVIQTTLRRLREEDQREQETSR